MYLGILQDLGLTPNEAKIYQTLIEEGESSAGEIATKGKIHRRNVYDTLDRLIEKGLIFQILEKGENIYKAVDPAKLLEILKEKENKLQAIMPGLQKSFEAKPSYQQAFIYRGVEGFKNYLRDILRLKKDVFFIGAKGLWFDPKLKTFIKSFLLEAKRLDIKYHHIFDAEVIEQIPEVIKDLGMDYKVLPKDYSTKTCIDIFGDRVVTFTGLGPGEIDEDVTLYVMVDDTMAEGYRTWFKYMWDTLPSPKGESGKENINQKIIKKIDNSNQLT
jgi:sugar-specific transcriptional regulator TrmB